MAYLKYRLVGFLCDVGISGVDPDFSHIYHFNDDVTELKIYKKYSRVDECFTLLIKWLDGGKEYYAFVFNAVLSDGSYAWYLRKIDLTYTDLHTFTDNKDLLPLNLSLVHD